VETFDKAGYKKERGGLEKIYLGNGAVVEIENKNNYIERVGQKNCAY
jgi:hypothetical protein